MPAVVIDAVELRLKVPLAEDAPTLTAAVLLRNTFPEFAFAMKFGVLMPTGVATDPMSPAVVFMTTEPPLPNARSEPAEWLVV